MKLISAGAAETVTGSCHLLELAGRKILVDCGMFQGPRELERKNREPFPFDVQGIDAVLITHAHLDHIGRLPLLFKRGYRGPIHATAPSHDIAKVILLDSAKIQQEDAERAVRKGWHGPESEPLYGEDDVNAVMGAMSRPVAMETPLELGPGLLATFYPAGHILGSAYIELDCPEGRIICSGDLGNRESGLEEDAAPPHECDAVLVETTYGDRHHRSLEDTLAEFREIVAGALSRGGNVMIPSFALERTQNVLYWLRKLMEARDIPEVPVYLDSPMATKMTHLYQSYTGQFQDDIADALRRGDDPFEPPTLRYTSSAAESKKLNAISGGAIIVAGSGMMTGGRILHHLKHNLWRPEASLVVVGYQAAGTLGRELVDGAREVRIDGDEIPVRASVHTVGGMSAHADQDDLLAWLAGTGKASIYMVHGEPEVMDTFAGVLAARGKEATRVVEGRPYDLASGKRELSSR